MSWWPLSSGQKDGKILHQALLLCAVQEFVEHVCIVSRTKRYNVGICMRTFMGYRGTKWTMNLKGIPLDCDAFSSMQYNILFFKNHLIFTCSSCSLHRENTIEYSLFQLPSSENFSDSLKWHYYERKPLNTTCLGDNVLQIFFFNWKEVTICTAHMF